MAAKDGVGSFLVGWLHLSIVRCRGQWKVIIMDKDGPGGAHGRKVCWMRTSIIGWHLCVWRTCPKL